MPEIEDHLSALRPCGESLLRWLAPLVDDAMLLEIAEADYGYRANQHLAPLLQIRRTARVDNALQWEPLEVLNLIHWSEPDDPEWQPSSQGRRGHLMRAFSCAALLVGRAHPDEGGQIVEEVSTLIQLVRSCEVIADEALREISRLLAWRMVDRSFHELGEERPFFGIALLLAQVQMKSPTMSAAGMIAIADWVAAEEVRWRTEGHGPAPERWLLGLTHFDLRHPAWIDSARRSLVTPRDDLGRQLQARLADLGKRLVHG